IKNPTTGFNMKNKKLIIYDWNGTLLNDIDACIDSMNVMLERRNMRLLDTTTYRKIFTFPVQEYYKSLGFDFLQESFEQLSVEYIDLYKKHSINASLQHGVFTALEQFKKRGFQQVILSASEQITLEKQINQHQLHAYFDALIGLDNIYAKSKLDNAVHYIQKTSISIENVLLIGDTYHDYEVARAIGCDCLLVNNGHQDLSQYHLNSNIIFQSLADAIKITVS
ncbi:MAG TPA: HAD family hydrolase, partial [Bacteroidales bacterium]|nr:HAD family hydrolase [Bacteroidales bacterium]